MALKPLTEKPEAAGRKKMQEEESVISIPSLKGTEEDAGRRINAKRMHIDRLTDDK